MGMGMGAVKLTLDLWNQGIFKGMDSVMEMGAQGLHLTLSDFEELLYIAGITGYRKEIFATLEKFPEGPGCSSKPLYEMLGIKNYSCIDMDKMVGAIPIDLNKPLEDKTIYGKYDIVTDYGTNEHVFNTAEAYRTLHKLCKKDGILMIGQVVYNGNGYYAYDSSFFEGIAAANNYKILFGSFEIALAEPTKSGSSNQFHVPLSRELLDALDWSKTAEIGIFYAMQKQSESDFCDPYQGGFLSTIQRNYGYKLQYLQGPPSRSYVPIFSLGTIPGRSLLPEFFRRIYRRARAYLSIR